MKILHLLNSNRFSGAENVVCQIVSMYREDANVEMIYVSLDGEIREALEERNIKFVSLAKMSVKEIRRVLLEEKPDIIHAHDMKASFYAAMACRKIPLISHIHNNAIDSRGISLKTVAYIFAAHRAKHIFWVSRSAFDGYAFHNYFKKKSSVLYNIIDTDALYEKMRLDTNEYDYSIIYVGRLSYPKNPHRLLNVFRLVKEKIPEIKIAVVGTGDLENEIKMLSRKLKLFDNVNFIGFKSNPLKILHDSKVMVMTSRWEGTPMCALEALALGVPIVSTPVDGLKELVINDKNGYLSNSDEVLSDNIVSIIQNEALHEKMSQEALQRSLRVNNKIAYKAELDVAYMKVQRI